MPVAAPFDNLRLLLAQSPSSEFQAETTRMPALPAIDTPPGTSASGRPASSAQSAPRPSAPCCLVSCCRAQGEQTPLHSPTGGGLRAQALGEGRRRRQGVAGGQERPAGGEDSDSARGRILSKIQVCRTRPPWTIGGHLPSRTIGAAPPASARGRRHGAPLPGVDRARRRTGPAHGRASSTQPGGALLAPRSAEPMMRPTLVGIHHVQLQK